MGFAPMAPTEATGGVARNNELRRYLKNKIRLRKVDKRRLVIPIRCRGDGRDFGRVREHKGALNRVDPGRNHMNAAWHPFSRIPHKDCMLFRLTSGDNCLNCVLSVAESMTLACGFPLIEDRQIFKFPGNVAHPAPVPPATGLAI